MVHHKKVLRHKKNKTPFDYVMYFFMVATPLFELPQAISVYSTQNAHGVSVWTWAFFAASSLVWLTYSIRNGLFPLIVTYSMYILIETGIVVGIILYS